MMKFVVKEWAELISDPISLGEQDQRVFEHADLPTVSDKLSITLRLKIRSHANDWATILHKGTGHSIRTPGLLLSAYDSRLEPQFSGNWNDHVVMGIQDKLMLNKWYHLALTLSDPEKRSDFYVDGEWIGFNSVNNVKTQKIVFNEGPLHIGRAFLHTGINGEDEFQKKPIVYGSKIALVHVSTRKYLSTKGIIYDLGPNNQQYMVVCNKQEIDLNDDVWIVIGENSTIVRMVSSVSLNTTIGFKHQETGYNLHSHDTSCDKVTPISKQQQVTMCRDANTNDGWLIRRYNSNTTSYDDSGRLMSGDIISLFHVPTNKPALCSHTILLGDGSQEVFCCYGDAGERNNKWRIELIE
ncbi:glycosyltransferase family 39 protein [Rhizophagus clarus]|uniref:Glycosyltransferase family 39 protein n=1 Tax=Rhizophagus clarus TaxID=94130 RepID=A0A8H3KZG8_9GLOM|nr:glycosyltransferase family 39 protein [Rhizophagus clarus]